jgi:hypothetical protein
LGLAFKFFQEFGGASIIAKKKKMGKKKECEKGQKEGTFENWSLMDVKEQNVNFFCHILVVEC